MDPAETSSTHLPPPSHSDHSQSALRGSNSRTLLQASDSRSSTIVDSGTDLRRNDNEDSEDVNSEFEREAYGPPEGEKGVDPYEVRMGSTDKDNPKTWSRMYRWYITMISAVLLLNACVCNCF